MTTFVLIGGAWHGAWCWRLVTPLLQAAGHKVFPLSLTGLGERAHLFTPNVDLSTHIRDVTNLFLYEDLHDVVLVGHSYAGAVITGVVGQMPERLGQLVYFDSYVPRDGESMRTRRGQEAPTSDAPPGNLSPFPPDAAFRLGINDPALAEWTMARLVPHPYRSFIEPVHYDEVVFNAIPRAFIACKDKPNPGTSAAYAEMAKADPDWEYRELWAGHDAMLTAPQAVCDALLELDHSRRYQSQEG